MAASARNLVDLDLAELPPALRWREWMGRVEAAIFAARDPIPRDTLAKLVGPECNLDHLLADIAEELRARPYDLVFVAGGYQLRTRPRFMDAIRTANGERVQQAGPPELTRTEMLTLTAVAYLQPATRAQISSLVGREISRDVVGALRRHGLIEAGLRVGKLGNSSVRYEVGIFTAGDDALAAHGHFVHVYVTRADNRPTPIPMPIRTALEPLVVA